MILKIIKFCLLRGTGMVLDFTLTYELKEKIKIHRYVANATCFVCAASSNFLLNRYWTFEIRSPEVYQQFGSFILFSVVGLGINSFFLYFFKLQIFCFMDPNFSHPAHHHLLFYL